MARFKELCLDTDGDSARIAGFWAAVVGARAVQSDPEHPDDYDVVGEHEHQGIAICRVPEPKTVKHRIHLDVYAAAVEDLVALGATVLRPAAETGFGWTVMADPEGGEFCAFVPDQLPAYRLHGIGVDSADSRAQAEWWQQALGGVLIDNTAHGDGWWTIENATPDQVLTMDFAPVPEPKSVKNRIHWDLYGTVEEFLDRGATRLRETPGWVVLADPEGNEFCVFDDPERGPDKMSR